MIRPIIQLPLLTLTSRTPPKHLLPFSSGYPVMLRGLMHPMHVYCFYTIPRYGQKMTGRVRVYLPVYLASANVSVPLHYIPIFNFWGKSSIAEFLKSPSYRHFFPVTSQTVPAPEAHPHSPADPKDYPCPEAMCLLLWSAS